MPNDIPIWLTTASPHPFKPIEAFPDSRVIRVAAKSGQTGYGVLGLLARMRQAHPSMLAS
jgi:hypothetical protein